MGTRALQTFRILVPAIAGSLAILTGWSIASSPLNGSHPIALGLVALVLVVALLCPYLGVLILLITLWLSGIYPASGEFTFNRVLGLAVLGGVVVRKAVRLDNKPFVTSRFDYLFWGFLCAVMASIALNGGAFRVGGRFRGLVMGYLLYFLIVNTIDSWQKLRRVNWILIVCTVLIAVGSIAEVLIVPVELRKPRVGGYLQNVHPTAQFCFISIILVFWLFEEMHNRKRLLRYMLYILPFTFSAAIFISGSRGEFAVLLITILLLVLLSKEIGTRLRLIVAIGIALVVSASLISPFAPVAVQRALSIVPGYEAIVGGEAERYAQSLMRGYTIRQYLEQAAWKMFVGKPILGVGFDSYYQLNLRYEPRLPKPRSGHNLFTIAFAETGLVGGGLLILMYSEAIITLWRAKTFSFGKEDDEKGAYAVKYVLALLVGLNIIVGVVSASYVERPMFVVFALGAVVSRLLSNSRRGSVSREQLATGH